MFSRPFFVLLLVVAFTCSSSMGQQPLEYGQPIELSMAKKIMLAAETEARNQKWPVAIAIVDTHGVLVMFQRLENTQYGSVQVAIDKAATAALFRRETKVFEDLLAEGGRNLKLLKLSSATPVEGGIPIIIDGKIVGAIGVSGVKSTEDAQVGKAGLKSLAP